MAPVLHGRRCIHAPADLCVYGDLQPERRFYAHRLLLMCISPYFEKVFRYRPGAQDPIVDCVHCNSVTTSVIRSKKLVNDLSAVDQQEPQQLTSSSTAQSTTNQPTGDQQKEKQRPNKRALQTSKTECNSSSNEELSLPPCTGNQDKENHGNHRTLKSGGNQPKSSRNKLNVLSGQQLDATTSTSSVPMDSSSSISSSSSSISSSMRPSSPSPTTSTMMMSCQSFSNAVTLQPFSTFSAVTSTADQPQNLLQICDCPSNNNTTTTTMNATTLTKMDVENNQLNAEDLHPPVSSSVALETHYTKKSWTTSATAAMQPFLLPPPPDQPPEQLCLVGLDAEQVEALLQFAYDGRVSLSISNVQSLCIAADQYSVQAMFDQCQQFLVSSLSVQNCVGVYVFAQQLQSQPLKLAAERYILRHFESVANRSAEFTRLLNADQLRNLLQQNRLYVSDEHLCFMAVVRWIQFDRPNRLSALPQLFTCIRLALINDQQLLESVLANQLITCHPVLVQLVERVLRCKARLQQLGRPDEQVMCDHEIQAYLTPRFPLDLIFVFGGRTLDVEFVPPEPVVEVYDHRAERWKQVAALQDPSSARDHHQTVVLNSEIYMLGGHSGPFSVFNSCRKYNLVSRKWTEIAPMKEKRAFLAAVVLNDCIYAIGGYNGAWRVDSAEKYNLKANQWQSIASMHERRSGAGAAVLNDRIYVVGGFRDLTYLNTAEFYCPQSNTWTMISLMQKPRSSPAVVSLNGFVYAIGGLTAGGLLSSGERYDPTSGSWTLLEREMVERKCSAAAVVLENKIFVIGGWNGVAGLNTIELWCPHSKRWLLGSKLAKRRTGCSACVVPDVPDIELYGWSSRDDLIRERFLNSFLDQTSTDSNEQSDP